MGKIESELLELTGIKGQKEKESETRYRARLVRAADDLSDEEWEGLSETAQDWVKKGIDAINEKIEIPTFPDGVATAEEEKPRRTKKDAEPQPEPVSGEKKRGGANKFRELMITHPDWEKDKLLSEVEKEGFKLAGSTAEVTYYEVKSTLKLLQKLGKLKEA